MLQAVQMPDNGFGIAEWFNIAFPSAKLLVYSRDFNVKKLTPFRNALLHAINFNVNIAACISHLLFRSRPPAVRGGIVSVDIFPVDRMFVGRLFTHVCQKVFERLLPSIADYDTSTSVVLKLSVIRIITASLHKLPSAPFWRSRQAMLGRLTVFPDLLSGDLFGQTATTKCGAADIRCSRHSLISAVAFAFPHGVVSIWNPDTFQNQKTTEFLTLNLSHATLSPNDRVAIRYMGEKNNRGNNVD